MINLNTKFSQSNKINKLSYLLKNSTILSLPSLIGIILAIIAIPVHLQINGKSDYGNYIFFHFIISFGLLLNIGINKIAAVEVAKKKYLEELIKQSLKISLLLVPSTTSTGIPVAIASIKRFEQDSILLAKIKTSESSI